MSCSGNRNCDKPRLIEALKTKRIRDIACGSSHSAAITSSGELYSWGLGEYGRLGHGDNTTQLRPKLVCAQNESPMTYECPPCKWKVVSSNPARFIPQTLKMVDTQVGLGG